jgi:hypothetical protein
VLGSNHRPTANRAAASMQPIGTVKMSIGSTVATIAVAPLPLNQSWLRPGAFAKLHDPSPAWATGLSRPFLERDYGHSFADVARAKREGAR